MHIAAVALEPGRIAKPACSPGNRKGWRARRIVTTGIHAFRDIPYVHVIVATGIHASRDVPHVLCIKKRRRGAGVGNGLADQLNSRTR